MKIFRKKSLLILGLLLSSGLFFLLAIFLLPYPQLRDFQKRQISTRIYDSDGKIIQITALENGVRREALPLEKIPENIKFYFIQSEDKNFYHHCGIDFLAIIRAAFQNASEFRTISGASTITMQLARIIRPAKNRNIFSKIQESIDALRIEARLSKSEILELYLNSLPFGFNTEGVTSAARTFFSKDLESLSEEESAILAVIPRRPSLYNPLDNPQKSGEAAYELYLSSHQKEIKDFLSLEDFKTAALHAKSFSYPFEFPHFVRHISQTSKNYIGQLSELHTTLNLNLQHKAEDLLSESLEKYEGNRLSNGAILVFESKSGEILAWVGSSNFFDDSHNGQIDGVLALEQAGSSMKPFLYALALENGFSPSTVLPDIPMEFGFENLYVPQNFNNRFNGPVRFRISLASSLNIPAVYLLNETGIEKYLQKLSALGFKSLENTTPGLSLALGSEEVSLFELAQAFSVFTRDGIFLPLKFTKESQDYSAQIYDMNTARIIADILSDKNARSLGFGYNQQFSTDFPAIFKTGTANQYQAITALGATPSYTVGVWMGNFSGDTVIGKTGSSIPAKIAKDLLVYLQGNKAENFKKPAQIKKNRICALSGMLATENCPDTVKEFVTSDTKFCDWHQKNEIIYPKEYASWFRLKNRNGIAEEKGGKLHIISPRNGSIFYYDASIPENQQKLVVEALGGYEERARFFVDGDFLQEKERPFLIQIGLKKGNHIILVECGDEKEYIELKVK